MRVPRFSLGRCFAILSLLAVTLCSPRSGYSNTAVGGTPPGSKHAQQEDKNGDTVGVLVLTARKSETRSSGLAVLAGLCLALSDNPDEADHPSHPDPSHRWKLSLRARQKVETKERGKAGEKWQPLYVPKIEPDELWSRLVDYCEGKLDQIHIIARWPDADRQAPSLCFCFADEHDFQAKLLDREGCQIIFGPVTSGEAVWVLKQMRRRPDVPILTPAATATRLPRDLPAFYRFITPDNRMVERLATELVQHVRPQQIAVLYEDTEYGRGLNEDFQEALRQTGPTRWHHISAFRYPRGDPLGTSRKNGGGQLPAMLQQFRILGVDALGIFGNLKDKQTILDARYPQHSPHPADSPQPPPAGLVFTTDADLGWEGYRCDGGVLIASLLDPHEPDSADFSAHAYALMSTRPKAEVQPNVYMLQSRRAMHFLLNVVKQMKRSGPSAAQLFSEHRQGQLAAGRADPPVEFTKEGDLDGDLANLQLLMLKHQELTAISQRPIHSLPDVFEHPIRFFLIVYLFVLAGVMVGRYAGAWEESNQDSASLLVQGKASPEESEAAAGFPPLFYERWLTWGRKWPDWLPYHLAAAVVFMIYAVIVIWKPQESFSFVPNEFSAIPTVFIQCHLAAVCLWYVASMRRELWQLHQQLSTSNLPELAAAMTGAARRVFTVSYRRHLGLIVLMAILLTWDALTGLPIVAGPGRWGYIVISIFTGYAYLFTLWFIWKANRLAQQLAEAYPLGENLWLTYHDFRMLVAPFVSMTYVAALVFAGVVISRSRFFNHWEWTIPHYLFFTVIAGLLLWLLFDNHRQWHLRLCQAKRRILDLQHPMQAPDEAQRKALEQVQAVPTWPWNPTSALRILSALAAPLVVALLQNYKWALDLWRAAGQLLGAK